MTEEEWNKFLGLDIQAVLEESLQDGVDMDTVLLGGFEESQDIIKTYEHNDAQKIS